MKNKFYFCLFICAYVFPQVLRAQSWTPPVIIEEVEGVGARCWGCIASLASGEWKSCYCLL
jgi:hypothetical protein